MRKTSLVVALMMLLSVLLNSAAVCADTYSHIVNPFRAYSYENMVEDATALENMYPDIVRLGSVGKSVEGRELLSIELGSGSRKIFVNGAIHASEYICTSYLMYMLDQYAYASKTSGFFDNFDVKDILDKVTFCIIPMVNPDGVKLVQNSVAAISDSSAVLKISANDPRFMSYTCWKANIQGVDLNRNFDNNWYVSRPIKTPAAKLFKGYSPVSEPETQAIVNYVQANMFWAFANFHSQGEGIYGWDDENAGYYPQLDSMVTRIAAASGFKKLTDTSATNYGTFAGYARETFLKPALTIELCQYVSCAPYPDSDFSSVWTPAQDFCLIIADEVLKMPPQKFLVFQNGTFLQAFCDEDYANAYASKHPDSTVIYFEGGCDKLAAAERFDATVSLNGVCATFPTFSIGGNTYFKLRDLAMALNGSAKQFSVSYDPATAVIALTSGQPYTPVGGEISASGGSGAVTALPTLSSIYLNRQLLNLTVYTIGSSNYFKLRDIGSAIDFVVTWDETTKEIIVDTSSGYGPLL